VLLAVDLDVALVIVDERVELVALLLDLDHLW
jgi:hypothetical protein